MTSHYRLFSETKQQYHTLFRNLEQALSDRLMSLKHDFTCTGPTGETRPFEHTVENATDICGNGCGYFAWRKVALDIVEREIPQDVLRQMDQIEQYRQRISCHMCGQCCRLASSEDDYATLKAKAAAGDSFAQEFTSIFLPYASREAARQRDAKGVADVLAFAEDQNQDSGKPGAAERIHFYYCPYLQEDNRCGVYGTDKRPSICSTYPETPLGYIAKACAWTPWQEDTHLDTLLAHAMLNLCEHWSKELRIKKNGLFQC
jgi:Fe-S-cluster containining protein